MALGSESSFARRSHRRTFRFELLENRHLLAANPVISEFMAENKNTLNDGYGNASDWIEIYNSGDAPIDLAGWHLTDRANNLVKWQFPNVSQAELDAGERIVVFASENQPGVVDPLGYLHANFKLSKEGEYVALVRPDGVTIASELGPQGTFYPEQYEDVSYGIGQIVSSTTLLAAGAPVNVRIPNATIASQYGTTWRGGNETAFAAAGGLSNWTSGTGTGVGYDTAPDYGARISTNIDSIMRNVNTVAWLRVPFNVTDASSIASLALKMDFDDAFVAYINGTEVARQFFTGEPTWNSIAETPNHEAGGYEQFDITSYTSALRNGANILAIVGLNRTADSSDFLILPELVATTVAGIGEVGFMPVPTPGGVNGASVAGFVDDTKFSVDRGFYDAPFDVTITSETPGATIVYTTNGSAPSLTNGTKVLPANDETSPIASVHVTGTTTLRAAAFKTDFEPTTIDSQTYVFVADVLTQPEMDPDVVNNPAYAGMIADALKSLPTMSLVMDNADMFGSSGIYTNSGNTGEAWERAVSVEFFDPNNGDEFQIDAGIRIHGADARNHQKKPLRIIFRGSYGASKLEFPFFADSPVEAIDKLVLRGGGHEGFTSPHSVQPESATFLRDTFLQQTHAAMGQLAPHSRYMHLYINGKYWGLYYAQERPDADFQSEYLGGEEEDWDVINTDGSVVDGDKAAWNSLMTLANAGVQNAAQYQAMAQLVDIDNLIDNMIVRIWSGDIDWLRSQTEIASTGNRNKNWYVARNRIDGQFRFFVWDGELSMGKNHTSNHNLSLNIADVDIADSPGRVYAALRNYAPFQLRFADRLQKHFFAGGAMTVENNQTRWNALADIVRDPVVAESARWGDAVRAVPLTRDNTWAGEVAWIANTFLTQRNATVLNQFRAMGLFPSLAAPTFSQYGGVIASPINVGIAAAAGTIYYTMDGSDPRDSATGNPAAGAITIASGQSVVISDSTLLRARVRSGTTWSPIVEATFHSVEPPSLRITEIMYNPAGASGDETATDNDDYEYVEIKNIGTDFVSLAGVRLAGGVEFAFSDGAIATLPPGGFVIVAKNATALAERYGDDLPIAGEFAVGTLDNAGESLQLFGSLGEVIHDLEFSDAWHALTDGAGFSLTIIDQDGDINTWHDAQAWKPSSLKNGSPGASDSNVVPNPGGVVINELSANARDAIGDRIEVASTTGQSIDLSNWYLSDDPNQPRKYALGAGTILGPGGFLVRTERDHFGSVLDLNPLGGELVLSAFNGAGELLGYQQIIEYGAAEPGVTHGRIVGSTGNADFVGLSSATFGAANSSPRFGNVVVNEIMYHPATLSEAEFIELRNTSGNAILLGTSATQTAPWRLRGAIDFAFPAGATIPANGYALVVQAAIGADLAAAGAAFRAARSVPATVPIFVYTDLANGSLSDGGEALFVERPTSNTLAADINADGIVSLVDLAIMQANLGVQSGATRASGDVNGDGAVTRADLAAFVQHFGGITPAFMYVTEDAVTYDDGNAASEHWPAVADGGGASLARVTAAAYGNDVANWSAGSIAGTPGAANSFLDTSPPAVPANVTATVISPSRIDVSWLASIDSQSGVAYYVIYRNEESIGTTSATAFQDMTAAAGVSYSYRVAAVNHDGFVSAQSMPPANVTIVGVELLAVSDSQTVVLRFSEPVTAASAQAAGSYQLTGGATVSVAQLDSDGRTVTLATSALAVDVGYTLSIANVVTPSGNTVAPQTTLVVVNTSVPLSQTWDFESQTLEGFVQLTSSQIAGDRVAFSGSPVSATQVTDESGVHGEWFIRSDWHRTAGKHGDSHTGILESATFRLGRNATFDFLIAGGNHALGSADPDNLAALPAATAISLEREVSAGNWEVIRSASGTNTIALAPVHWDAAAWFGQNVRLRIYDLQTGGWGHISVDNIVYDADPLTGDQTPPSKPTNLAATVANSTQVNVSWTPSIDHESSIARYVVSRNGAQIGTSPNASFVDTTVPGIGNYSYTVVAVNVDDYASAPSDALAVNVLGIQSAIAVDATTVQVVFTAPLDQLTAENSDNYLLGGGAGVVGAELAAGNTVLLTTTPLTDGLPYTLSVAAVVSALGYPVVSQTQTTVTYSAAGIITGGLIQDLNADVGVTHSAGVVSNWANQISGSGDDVSTNSGTAQLVAGPNGHQAISLVGNTRLAGDDHAAFDAIMQGTGYTWFIVADPDAQTGQAVKNVMAGTLVEGSPWTGFAAGVQQDGRGYHMIRPDNDLFATGTTATIASGYQIYIGRLAAGTGARLTELFVNSAAAQGTVNATISAAINSGALTIGAERQTGGEFFDGDIARVLIYNRPLSNAELMQVGHALAQRYGISATFVPGSPTAAAAVVQHATVTATVTASSIAEIPRSDSETRREANVIVHRSVSSGLPERPEIKHRESALSVPKSSIHRTVRRRAMQGSLADAALMSTESDQALK